MKKVRTFKDIKNDSRVSDIYHENDQGIKSWWCTLKAGWQDSSNPECHTLHEGTISQICELVNNAKPFPNDPQLID